MHGNTTTTQRQPPSLPPRAELRKRVLSRRSDRLVNASRAEVRLWLQRTLALREGHALNHIRWLQFALGRWFFNTDDGMHGAELWETDLTVDGTLMVRDIRPGSAGSFPHHKCEYRGRIYFAADDGAHGTEPWVSDGTPGGTHLFVDAYPGPRGSFAQGMLACGAALFFAASNPLHGYELWVSDGTEAGTHVLDDLTPGHASSQLGDMACADGVLHFTLHGRYRYRSDGTRRGTRVLSESEGGPRTELRRQLAETLQPPTPPLAAPWPCAQPGLRVSD